MGSNAFGSLFRFTSWGESHGPAVGVVVDGCPAGIALDEATINRDLVRRAPGSSAYVTARKEPDTCEILSGVFQGQTTGAPICIHISNKNADSSSYEAISHLLRPGHANYTYLQKYGTFDYRGGGRASARETACRVAAGAVARALLGANGIFVTAWLSAAGDYTTPATPFNDISIQNVIRHARSSHIFAPCAESEKELGNRIAFAKAEGDSIGGIVSFYATGLPAGLGDPVYEKLEACLAAGLLSIPACKGFEVGAGFAAASMRGSECNDIFISGENGVRSATNHAGGMLGGITTGMPVYGRAAFKPTPSIRKAQATLDRNGRPATLQLPKKSRHDPCVAVRAVPVVEAMCLVVLADAWLRNLVATIKPPL